MPGVVEALNFIKNIVSERVVIVSYLLNDEWHGSTGHDFGVDTGQT